MFSYRAFVLFNRSLPDSIQFTAPINQFKFQPLIKIYSVTQRASQLPVRLFASFHYLIWVEAISALAGVVHRCSVRQRYSSDSLPSSMK